MLLFAVSVESWVRQVSLIAMLTLKVATIVVVFRSTRLLLATSTIAVIFIIILSLPRNFASSAWHLILVILLGEVSVIIALNDLLRHVESRVRLSLELLLVDSLLVESRLALCILVILHCSVISAFPMLRRSRVKSLFIIINYLPNL